MKKRAFLPLCVCCALVGCQVAPETPAAGAITASGDKPQGYEALPGKAATSQTPTETDAAFEAAAAALPAGRAPEPAAPAEMPGPTEPEPVSTAPAAVHQAAAAAEATQPLRQAESPSMPTAEALATQPSAQPVEGSAGYALQITNGTNWRLFIEVEDSSGNIFPFGFMNGNQRLCAQPQEPKPIEGQLAVIIRDPDSPGAPEVKRYMVTPPPHYMGKTIGVTILPGQFRATVDGEVYYTSPLPEDKQPTPVAQ